jgi:hypothetical protein
MAIGEAVALEALRLKHLPEYTPPGYTPYTAGDIAAPDIWPRLELIAQENGLDVSWFYALSSADIQEGTNWVTVTVTAKDAGMDVIKSTAVGFPTWAVGGGDEWFTDSADIEGVTGVLPIGIQTNAIPPEALNGSTTFLLRVAADLNFEAQPVQLPGGSGDPTDHLIYLTIEAPPDNSLEGTPPPTVRVGDQVAIVFRQGPPGQNGGGGNNPFEDFSDLMSDIVGRVVIVPLLDGTDVIDFVLLQITDSAKVVTTEDQSHLPPGQSGITPPHNPGHGGTPPGHGGPVPGLGPGVFLEAVDVVFRFVPSRVARSTYRHPDQPIVDPLTVDTMGKVLRPSIWETIE